jgi:hypothetical protein
MTEKKKDIDKNLKSLIKNFKRREAITSHINDNGELVKNKYSPLMLDDEHESIELLNLTNDSKPSSIYGKKIHDIRRNVEDDTYNQGASSRYYRKPKHKSTKAKRCRCK